MVRLAAPKINILHLPRSQCPAIRPVFPVSIGRRCKLEFVQLTGGENSGQLNESLVSTGSLGVIGDIRVMPFLQLKDLFDVLGKHVSPLVWGGQHGISMGRRESAAALEYANSGRLLQLDSVVQTILLRWNRHGLAT